MPNEASKTPDVYAILQNCTDLFPDPIAMGVLGFPEFERVPTDEFFCVLRESGLDCTERELAAVTHRHTSARGVFEELAKRHVVRRGVSEDVAYVATVVLCRRLFPDWVSIDTYQRRVLEARRLHNECESGLDGVTHEMVVDAFGRAWEMATRLARAWGVSRVAEFDRKAEYVYPLYEFAQDFDDTLCEASRVIVAMAEPRRAFIHEFAEQFPDDTVRVLEMSVEPDGAIKAEYTMLMSEPTGTLFAGEIDDELMDALFLD